MNLASIQLEIIDTETPSQRVDRVDGFLDSLKDCDLIMLPEIWKTGFNTFDRYIEDSESLNGYFIKHFSQKARDLKIYLFGGSFVESFNGKYYNTSVLFDPRGKLIATYHKIHLFSTGDSLEGMILTRGKKPTVVNTELGPIGLSTCYDLRFPELYRRELDLGAKLFLVTSAWPIQRISHWELFNAARAVENQCFLASCNCVGFNGGTILGGHSKVINPWGEVLATAGDHEEVLKIDIDMSIVDKIRDEFPQLKHRFQIEE